MTDKEFEFTTENILSQIPHLNDQGINELTIHDRSFASSKPLILKVLQAVKKYNPQLFLSFPIEVSLIDKDIIKLCSELYTSIDIPLIGNERNGTLLFDKKLYS